MVCSQLDATSDEPSAINLSREVGKVCGQKKLEEKEIWEWMG